MKTFIVLGLGIIVIGITVFALNYFALNYYGTTNYSERCELNIEGGIEKAKCYVDLCENLTGTEKAKCYFDRGDLNRSLEVCENMSEEIKDECYGRLATIIASKNYSLSLDICKKISSPTNAIYCCSKIAGIVALTNITKAESICEQVFPQEICYGVVGRVLFHHYGINTSIEFCKRRGVDVCFIYIARTVVKDDIENAIRICEISKSKKCKYYILPDIVKKNADRAIELCDDHICYIGIARDIADDDINKAIYTCDKIKIDNFRIDCYYFILIEIYKKDEKTAEMLCEKIIPRREYPQLLAPYCNISKYQTTK